MKYFQIFQIERTDDIPADPATLPHFPRKYKTLRDAAIRVDREGRKSKPGLRYGEVLVNQDGNWRHLSEEEYEILLQTTVKYGYKPYFGYSWAYKEERVTWRHHLTA